VSPNKASQLGVATPDTLTDFTYRADECVELDRAQCFDILQHGGLERAESAGHGVPVLRGFAHLAADAGTDGGGLGHGARAEATHQLVVEHLVRGRARERRDRIHGHVAHSLYQMS